MFHGFFDFRELLRYQFFATRPDKYFIISFYKLSADAVPFIFCLPVGNITQFLRFFFERIRQAERIWFGIIGINVGALNQVVKVFFFHFPGTHNTVHQNIPVHAGELCQRIDKQFFTDTNPETAADELIENEPFNMVQAVPSFQYIGFFFFLGLVF